MTNVRESLNLRLSGNHLAVFPDQFTINFNTEQSKIKWEVDFLIEDHKEISELDKKIEIIKDYSRRFPIIFWDSFDINITDKEEIIDNFLDTLYQNVNIWVEYQNILSDYCEVVFNEWLLRIESEDESFKHFDFLELHKDLWKWLNTFYFITKKIFQDIKDWKIKSPISINAEVEDILDDQFIVILKRLSLEYWVDLKSEVVIIEILENQSIPNTKEFKEKINQLKNIWVQMALDDIETNSNKIKEAVENIMFLWDNIDIVKFDWKTLQWIYKTYKTDKKEFAKILIELKNKIELFFKKWIKVVAEWIEDLEIYDFVKNVLWIKLYQWFYSKDTENLKTIRESINN